MPRPLAGIRVVEIGQEIQGPYVGLFLADLGADVVKVEPRESGDLARWMKVRFLAGDDAHQAWAGNIQEQAPTPRRGVRRPAAVGTPDEIWDKITKIRKQSGFDTWAPTLWYGGMPLEDAEKSLKLFAREVVPALKQLPPAAAEAAAPAQAAAR